MSAGARVAALVVVAAVAFGAALLVFTDGSGEPAEVGSGPAASTNTTNASGSGAAGGRQAEEDPCVHSDVVGVDQAGYVVTVATEPDPPRPQGTTFEIRVERDGAPVSGATVCVSADMAAMSHADASGQADEVGAGRYELAISFGMRGSWTGRVLILEPGERPASKPIGFSVK